MTVFISKIKCDVSYQCRIVTVSMILLFGNLVQSSSLSFAAERVFFSAQRTKFISPLKVSLPVQNKSTNGK